MAGHREFKELEVALTTQTKRVLRGITRLFKATEVMKVHGFPSGEASRLNQFVQKMLTEWELIKAMKEYRTPHAMRGVLWAAARRLCAADEWRPCTASIASCAILNPQRRRAREAAESNRIRGPPRGCGKPAAAAAPTYVAFDACKVRVRVS